MVKYSFWHVVIGGLFLILAPAQANDLGHCRYTRLNASTQSPVIDRNGTCVARVQCGPRAMTVQCRPTRRGRTDAERCPTAPACVAAFHNAAQSAPVGPSHSSDSTSGGSAGSTDP